VADDVEQDPEPNHVEHLIGALVERHVATGAQVTLNLMASVPVDGGFVGRQQAHR
jgi:hypothetical protein